MFALGFSLIFGSLSLVLAASTPTSFVLIGDSTTANGTSLNSGGWGNGFCGSPVNGTPSALEANTPCINTARNGATTGSFVVDGWWDISVASIKTQVSQGRRTFATLQFGHNDQKVASPESMAANLTGMVRAIRGLGAEPILVTSLTRRGFGGDGSVVDTLQPWADAAVEVAKEEGTRVLELHGVSIGYCEAIGEEACQRLNKSPSDNTHLNNYGAIVFGRMVADLMVAAFPPNDLPIISNAALTYNITHGIPSY